MYIEIVVHRAGLEKLKRLGKKGFKFRCVSYVNKGSLGSA